MPEAQKEVPVPRLKYKVGHSPQMHLDLFSSLRGTDIVFFLACHSFMRIAVYVMRAGIFLFARADERDARKTGVTQFVGDTRSCGGCSTTPYDNRPQVSRSRERMNKPRRAANSQRCCGIGAIIVMLLIVVF